MPPNSARVVSTLAVNSWTASTEGCDTLSGLPKLPNVVSMPSTFTLMPVCARARRQPLGAVSHLHHARHGQWHDLRNESRIARIFRDAAQVGGGFDDLPRQQDRPHGRRFHLDGRRRRFRHQHFGGVGRDLEVEILPHGAYASTGNRASRANGTFRARFQLVDPWRQVREGVGPAGVGRGRAPHTRILVRQGDGSVRNRAAGGVLRQSGHGSQRGLSVRAEGQHTEDNESPSHMGTTIVSHCWTWHGSPWLPFWR